MKWVVILWGVGLVGCGSRSAVLQGRVVDAQGVPIRGALVETEPMTDRVRTNAEGRFEIREMINDRGDLGPLTVRAVDVRIRRAGYRRATRAVSVRGVTRLEDVVLVADIEPEERALEGYVNQGCP